MKTSFLAIMLACALVASAQDKAQTPPAAPGGADQSAPTIKDPAEYNAYVTAYQQTDVNAKISALEAFLAQYPSSVMKTSALELLMNTYLGANNQPKVVDSAKRLLTADSCNLRALALLTVLARQGVASGQNPQQNLSDLTQYSTKGSDCVKTGTKPAAISDADFDKLKKQVATIFSGGAGFAALQNKDYTNAQVNLKAAVEGDPNDLQNVYPLAMSYLTATPPDSLNGLFYIARSASLAPAGPSQNQILTYGQKVYKNYHGSDQGWSDYAVPTAKTATSPPPDWGTRITKYVPPTPAQQSHDLVNGKTPGQIKQLSFGEWELVLSSGSPEDQDKVWSVIKSVPLQMEGTVLTASTPEADPPSSAVSVLTIAASEDDIEQKKADITITMTGAIPARTMPKEGDTLDFEGTPASYVPTPFMMTMEKGLLLKKAGTKPAPKPKPPVHHRPVRKPQ